MKHFSLYNFIDNSFKLILLFLFNFIWCSYFFNGKSAFFISLALAIILCLITNKISNIKFKKLNLKNNQKAYYESVKTSLLLMTNSEVISFFYNLASTKHSAIKHNCHIEVLSNNSSILLWPIFKMSDLTTDDIINIYKKVKHKKIKRLIFLTNTVAPNVQSLVLKFNFETIVYNYEQTFNNLLLFYNYFPPTQTETMPKKNKTTFSQVLKIAFNKKRTKDYLLSAIFIFFSSFFVVYKVYYCLISSLLVLFAIFSYFNPSFNKKTSFNPLD